MIKYNYTNFKIIVCYYFARKYFHQPDKSHSLWVEAQWKDNKWFWMYLKKSKEADFNNDYNNNFWWNNWHGNIFVVYAYPNLKFNICYEIRFFIFLQRNLKHSSVSVMRLITNYPIIQLRNFNLSKCEEIYLIFNQGIPRNSNWCDCDDQAGKEHGFSYAWSEIKDIPGRNDEAQRFFMIYLEICSLLQFQL